MSYEIDTTFDFRSDALGRDPDSHSPTLRRYHELLWSKPLPSGKMFEFVGSTPKPFIRYSAEAGEFWLTSDSVIPTFTRDMARKKWTRNSLK